MEGSAGARTGDPLLEVKGIVKSFPGLLALDGVSLDVRSGEIVAVIGHNGSGKSTLVKILAGLYAHDAGSIELRAGGDRPTEMHFIHQDLGLVPALSAVENLNLGKGRGVRALAPHRGRPERERARSLLARFGSPFPVDVPISTLAPAQRSVIAIARALDSWQHDENVLVLDEPTEALHATEVETLFAAVRGLARQGAGVIFISHRLDEVLALADRVVVLRDGRMVADRDRAGLQHDALAELLTGTTPRPGDRSRGPRTARPVLSVAGLSGRSLRSLDVDLHGGEIVGIAGVLGSGREDVPALLFGAAPSTSTHFRIDGEDHRGRTPAASIRAGMAFVAGDRARFGSVRPMNARENLTLPDLRSVRTRLGSLALGREKGVTAALCERYDVRPRRPEQTFALFSGGNQQKLVLAKWLRNDPRVLLLEEPTQGVDVGAKSAIYGAVEQAARRGAAVLVCSSDDKELLRLCDRVLVLRSGSLAADLQGDSLTERSLVLEAHGLRTAVAADGLMWPYPTEETS